MHRTAKKQEVQLSQGGRDVPCHVKIVLILILHGFINDSPRKTSCGFSVITDLYGGP